MKVGSLFAGIGGFDLAARWMGWSTAWFSEIEPYPSRVLEKHWPGVPNHGDIRNITGAAVEPVDMLVGGFPCQDISLAGKGEGIEGERSGLWKEYARLIGELRPRWVIAENVSALRSRGLDVVLQDLAALGYAAEWHCIPAYAVGAPHQRDRLWLIAYPNTYGERLQGRDSTVLSERARQLLVGAVGTHRITGGSAPMANSHGSGLPGIEERHGSPGEPREGAAWVYPDGLCDARTGAGYGAECLSAGCPATGAWWEVEPAVGRVANGIPDRVHRLKALGNAIVPQVAYLLFQAIDAAEKDLSTLR